MATAPAQDPAGPPFAGLLRHLRRSNELTQEELAERAGLSARLISDLERGVIMRPRRDTIQMLADGLELSGADRDDFVLFARHGGTATQPSTTAINLPAQPTTLIGRESDLAAAIALLRQAEVRLVTFTGPGGVGKTRLALETARRLAVGSGGCVDFVDLAPITTADGIWAALAQRNGVSADSVDERNRRVIEALGSSRRLLVLDNLEQIPDAGSAVANLILECPDLRVIATSRGPLHIRVEHEYPVSPLGLPDVNRISNSDELQTVPAVALLVQRGASVRPSFALTEANATAVVEIVIRLDGLPLAIELAAARLRLLSPADLLARMDQMLPILTGGAADLPERLQTMRSAVEWSYALLSGEEQTLLRSVAVFSGGFTIDGAEAVIGDGIADVVVLDNLAALVDQNLIQVGDDADRPSVRYRMLQTIREFGLEMLREAGEERTVRERHAQWCADLAVRSEPELTGPNQHFWFDELATEHDNLRSALEWDVAERQAELALRTAGSLYRFWTVRGHIIEAQSWLRRVLALPGCDPSVVRGNALLGAGVMEYFRGDLESAQRQTQAAQSQYLQMGHQLGVGHSYGNLGMIADAAGDDDAAIGLYAHALATFRELGDRTCTGYMLGNLGLVAFDRGDFDEALSRFSEALALFRELGNTDSIGYLLSNLGTVELAAGNYGTAAELHGEALQIRRSLRNMGGIMREINKFAQISLGTGDVVRAATLFGAAARLQLELGIAESRDVHAPIEAAIAAVREAVGEAAFSEAWEQGVSLTTDEAIDLALRWEDSQAKAIKSS